MCICACMHDKIITQMTPLLVSHDLNTIYKPYLKWRSDVA